MRATRAKSACGQCCCVTAIPLLLDPPMTSILPGGLSNESHVRYSAMSDEIGQRVWAYIAQPVGQGYARPEDSSGSTAAPAALRPSAKAWRVKKVEPRGRSSGSATGGFRRCRARCWALPGYGLS